MGLKKREMFYFFVKYIVIYTLVRYEIAFFYWLFNIHNRISWRGLLLAIGIAGFDLAIYYLLRHNRLLTELDRKIAVKIFRIHIYK
jgi:hypothetical protein